MLKTHAYTMIVSKFNGIWAHKQMPCVQSPMFDATRDEGESFEGERQKKKQREMRQLY